LHSFIDVVSPLTPICEVRLQTVVSERFKITTSGVCPHTVSASGSPASAQGASEGFLFAGQKESRVHPSIKAASEAAAVSHTAADERRPRESKKSDISAYFSHRRRKRGAGKSVRRRQGYGGTGKGVSPRRASSAPRVRGVARLSRAVKPCIISYAISGKMKFSTGFCIWFTPLAFFLH